jgi:hypothetical protein
LTVWFKLELSALDDPRIALLGVRLGISDGDAFKACCRVWGWLYQRGPGPMAEDEVNAVGRYSGLAEQLVSCGLAEATTEGLRIKGEERARKFADLRVLQKAKSALGVEARMAAFVMPETNDNPPGDPGVNPRVNPDILSLDLRSGSLDQISDRSRSLDRVAQKRHEAECAAYAWVEWFNRRFTRAFTASPELVKQVSALLARGYSEKPDMRGVALYLRSRWEDDEKMRGHLVPSTILRITKFAERLDAAREWDRESGATIWGSP